MVSLEVKHDMRRNIINPAPRRFNFHEMPPSSPFRDFDPGIQRFAQTASRIIRFGFGQLVAAHNPHALIVVHKL